MGVAQVRIGAAFLCVMEVWLTFKEAGWLPPLEFFVTSDSNDS